MSKTSRKRLTFFLSIVTVSVAAAIGFGAARAGDNVTEDQILHALAPAKKPLTRGLPIGPQTTAPATSEADSKFVQGKSRLKDPSHPFAEANRRVQVVNMADKTASK